MSMHRYRRWSDHDHHLGPFITYAAREPGNRWWGVVLDSGDDESRGCHARFYLGWCTVLVDLPQIIRPWRNWVDCSKYEWAKSPTEGYWDVHSREFGFQIVEGHLSVMHGPQTNDSITTKRWGCFLPWTQWRHVRHSFYDQAGAHFWTEPSRRQVPGGDAWDAYRKMEAACPAAVFAIKDHDGQQLQVTTRIDEREWRFGDGWFKWLSLFRRPRVRRSLDIEFSSECGPDKGSWKGGLIGTGIEMRPGELHEAAFRRYCQQEHSSKNGRYTITFLGRVS